MAVTNFEKPAKRVLEKNYIFLIQKKYPISITFGEPGVLLDRLVIQSIPGQAVTDPAEEVSGPADVMPTQVGADTDLPTMHRNVEYGQATGEKLLLDVCEPHGDSPFPVAIYVHGGGWTGGDKANPDDAPVLDLLTEAKFTWFSINYRLAPQHRWPACINDVQTAIRWVKANAARYKGDPSRIVLIGYSAGGHLACFAATIVDDSVRVQAVVGYAPLTDFVQELPKRGNILGRAQLGKNNFYIKGKSP